MHAIINKKIITLKVAIIGAGISGVSCGALLRDDGIDCHVYEQRSIIGGLVRCSIEKDDVLFHRVGGHVFNTKVVESMNGSGQSLIKIMSSARLQEMLLFI